MWGRNCSAPSAQLNPIDKGLAWATELQKAATVCPDKVRPLRSVMVPDIIRGRRSCFSSKQRWIAKIAALALRVSNAVSMRIMSAPPSISPFVELP